MLNYFFFAAGFFAAFFGAAFFGAAFFGAAFFVAAFFVAIVPSLERCLYMIFAFFLKYARKKLRDDKFFLKNATLPRFYFWRNYFG